MIHGHKVKTIDGKELALSAFKGKAVLIVNTASECGYTPQYEGLQALHEQYKGKGLEVLGFPCNDFGGQEPGSESDIKAFCSTKFKVTFPMFAKVKCKGDKSPLYKTLTENTPAGIAGDVKWNFTKFLADKEGNVVARFESAVDPLDGSVTAAIDGLLVK